MIAVDKTEDILISVIIPSYNHGKYLSRALQSMLDQTYAHWEVIIVDNYSTDNTDTVIDSYSDSRIRCIKINNNGVIATSRNLGIKNARGSWVAFLDSDDWWVKDKLLSCTSEMNEEVDFIYHDLEIVGAGIKLFGKNLIKSWQVKHPALEHLLVRGNAIATSSVLVRLKLLNLIGGMNQDLDMVGAEDYNAWLRIAELGARFKYIPKVLGYYQVHAQGISRKNMAIPVKTAVNEFIDHLATKKQNMIAAQIKYLGIRYCISAQPLKNIQKDLLFCMRFGRAKIKIKIMILLGIKIFKG